MYGYYEICNAIFSFNMPSFYLNWIIDKYCTFGFGVFKPPHTSMFNFIPNRPDTQHSLFNIFKSSITVWKLN